MHGFQGFSWVSALALLAASCAPSNNESAPASSSPPAAAAPLGVFGKAPSGALVTLDPVSAPLPVPAAPAVMDQYGKQFVPGELFVRVGQPVEFRNTEDQIHNVIVARSRTGTGIFHVSTDPGEKYVHTFDRPGRYEVSCDLHLGMSASIIATTSPYFAVSDATGAFLIRDVEPGSYKLTVSFDGRDTERAVEVSGPSTEVK